MSVIAQAIDLTKIYRTPASEIAVFESLNLVLTKSKLVAVIGPSGAGKSTLLHLLGGLDTPTRGTVLFKGQNVFEMNATELAKFRNRHVGFVFQFHHLLPEFTAVENTMMPKLIRGDEKSATATDQSGTWAGIGVRLPINHAMIPPNRSPSAPPNDVSVTASIRN